MNHSKPLCMFGLYRNFQETKLLQTVNENLKVCKFLDYRSIQTSLVIYIWIKSKHMISHLVCMINFPFQFLPSREFHLIIALASVTGEIAGHS